MPVRFAAPTAGNGAFATAYATTFPNSRRYFNRLDAVPLAWAQLEAINNIYGSELDGYYALVAAVDFFEWLMGECGVSYTQPLANNQKIPGEFDDSVQDWFEEADLQHHVTTHLKLLGGPSVAADFPYLLTRRRV